MLMLPLTSVSMACGSSLELSPQRCLGRRRDFCKLWGRNLIHSFSKEQTSAGTVFCPITTPHLCKWGLWIIFLPSGKARADVRVMSALADQVTRKTRQGAFSPFTTPWMSFRKPTQFMDSFLQERSTVKNIHVVLRLCSHRQHQEGKLDLRIVPFQLSTPTSVHRVDESFAFNAPIFSFVQKYLLGALEETKINRPGFRLKDLERSSVTIYYYNTSWHKIYR